MTNQNAEEFIPISLSDLWGTIKRRYKIIVLAVICLFVLAIGYIATTDKTYYSQSTILLGSQKKNIEIENLVNNANIDSVYISSEIQVLLSEELMAKVLGKLGIFDYPHLLKFSNDSPLPLDIKHLKTRKKENSYVRNNHLVNYAIKNLTVSQTEKSRAIKVGFSSKNKNITAPLINALIKTYAREKASSNKDLLLSTNSLLMHNVKKLQQKVKKQDTEIVEYKKKTGLIDSNGIALIENEMSQLSKILINAQTRLATAQIKWTELSSLKHLNTAPEVLKSPLIQKLINRQAENKDKVAELRKEYGPQHPEMISASNRLIEVNKKIDEERNKIASSLEREYNIEKENVRNISAQLEEIKSKYNGLKVYSINLSELERESVNSNKLLEKLSLRLKEIQVQEGMEVQQSNLRVLSKAIPPTAPKSPKPKLIIAIAIICGLGLGIAVAIVMDFLQTGVYNGKQLQIETSMTNIALVPKLNTKQSRLIKASVNKLKDTLSDYTESIRSVSSYLRNVAEKDPSCNIFNFTSISRGDGKSALVAAVAAQLSLEGCNVLVIDCDIRNPTLGAEFGLNNKEGLIDLLSKDAEIEDVIHTDNRIDVSFISIGKNIDINIIKKSSKIWKTLLKDLACKHDIVILDGPPAIHISDMSLLAEQSQNIICVPWKKAPLKNIKYTQNLLLQLNFKLIGTVITLASPKKVRQLSKLT